jgi:hypothetical protein
MLAVIDLTTDTTATLQKAAAVALANAAGRALPAGYFDQVTTVATGASATAVAAATGNYPLAAVGDNVIFGAYQIDATIASVASGVEQEEAVTA